MTETSRSRGLSAEIVIKAHEVRESQPGVIDLQKVGDEIVFTVNQIGDLFQKETENLVEVD